MTDIAQRLTELTEGGEEQPTLRDHFAMATLACIDFQYIEWGSAHVADYAYEIADAMMERRKR